MQVSTKGSKKLIVNPVSESHDSFHEFLMRTTGSSFDDVSAPPDVRSSTTQPQLFPPIRRDSGMYGVVDQEQSDIDAQADQLMTNLDSSLLLHSNSMRGGRPQKSVSGSQFRLPPKDIARCQQCDNYDRSLKKAKETIRTLKLQLGRFEEKVHDLRKARPETGNSPEMDALMEEKALLLRQAESMANEISALKKKCSESDLANMRLESSVAILQRDLADGRSQLEVSQAEKALLAQEKQAATQEIESLRKLLSSLNSTAAETNSARSKLERDYQDSLSTISQLKAELIQRDVANQGLTSQISDLNLRIKSLTDQLQKAASERDDFRARWEASGKEIEILKKEVYRLHENESDSRRDMEQKNSQIKKLEMSLSDKAAENSRLTAEVTALRLEVAGNDGKQSELIKKMTADSESSRLALERAITSSVRLCVVAPTVNVHIPEKKISLRAGVNEAQLKEFLNTEVLEKYCFLFKQRRENSSPDDSVSIQVWVEQMLRNMQSAIEQHVYRAIDGTL